MDYKRRILAAALFTLPCLFFVLAYFLMSMSGEDVTQANDIADKSFFGIIAWVYSYIPRIGEFITWPTATALSYQTSFGIDLLVRIIDVVAVVAIIYLLSFLVLRRHLRLKLFDAVIFNVIFLLLVLIPQLISPLFGNPFLSGFSFIHNYVTMTLIAIMFVIPFFAPLINIKEEFKILKNPFVICLLGFLFAISTEILPVAFVATIILYCLYKKFVAHEKIQVFKWQIFAVVGIFVGLAFFYLGGGLSARTGYTYAETYDYISLSTLLTAPRYFLITFITHFSRNIIYMIPIFSFSILAITTYRLKNDRANKNKIRMLILFDVFSLVYITGTSLILLDDALSVRFLLPCYILLIFAIGLYVVDFYKVLFNTISLRLVAGICLVLLSVIVVVDMTIGKVRYAVRTSNQLAEVREKIENDSDTLCLTKAWAASEAGPIYSPIFSFTQEPIFEPWNVKTIYDKEIVWAEIGEEAICE